MSGTLRQWSSVKRLSRSIILSTSRPLTYSFLKHQLHTSARCLGSSIFISDRHGIGSHFVFNHGFQDRLKDREALKRSVQLRGCDIDINQLEKEFNYLCKLERRKKELESQRKAVAGKMAELVKTQGKASQSKEQAEMKKTLISRGKKLKEEQREFMPGFWDVEERVMLKILQLPSNLLDDVTNKEQILEQGFQENKKELKSSHVDLINNCKDIKLSSVGDRAYYLRGKLARLEQELLDRFSTGLRNFGFSAVLAPEMFKTPVLEAGSLDVTSPVSAYRLSPKPVQREVTDWDTDHSFLRGASHLSFLAFLARLDINRDCLPLSMFAVGRNYSPVNDSENLPGLYGVTQTHKVNVCGVAATSEGCEDLIQKFRNHLTSLYREFQIPYRLVSLPARSLQLMEQNRLELQFWAPGLQKYIKVASLSACADFSSRRLMITSSDGYQGSQATPVHMVHGEFADITRLITLLLEYDQIK